MRADETNKGMVKELAKISSNRNVIDLYYETMIDVFRSRSKDKNQVLKKLQEEIGAHRKRLDSAQQMRLDGEIEPKEYQEIKIKYEKRISDIMREVANITNVDSDYQEYLDFGFHLIANIATYYAEADALAKEEKLAKEKADREANEKAKQAQTDLIEKYKRKIYETVKRQWSIPPKSDELKAQVRVTLLPDGDVRSILFIKRSGNNAFDASIEAAINKASPLPVPNDPALFDQFRSLTFNFSSKD